MNNNGKIWLMALCLGILLPGLLFSAAEKILKKPNTVADTKETTQETQHISDAQNAEEILISVLMADQSIENMPIGEYLTCVLLGEMPADFDMEALKAQAVVARTYALKRNSSNQKHSGGGVCTESTCCQSYITVEDYLVSKGTQDAVNKVRYAVNSTNGQVLTYQGALIEATYFSCSGGRTEDAVAVWGTDIPYLQSVDSPGEENAAYYKDSVTISTRDFVQKLGIPLTGNPSAWFGSVNYTHGGGVDTMVIGGRTFQGTHLRQLLGLRSTAFTITAIGDTLYIQTKGFGHRVGMSQYGAEAMAVAGSSYAEILQHYYPNTVLETYIKN